MHPNSFETRSTLTSGGAQYTWFSLEALRSKYPSVGNLPVSLRILLENLLRLEDGRAVTKDDIEALA